MSRKPEAGPLGPRRSRRPISARLAAGVIVDPNITHAAAVRRVELRGLRSVRHRHAVQRRSSAAATRSSRFRRRRSPARAGRWPGARSAIAASYNDRAFVGGMEVYTRDIRQRPRRRRSGRCVRSARARRVRLEYDWDYNRFSRSGVTDPAFVIPRNQNAHGLRAGLDLQRAGLAGIALGEPRASGSAGRGWGVPGSPEDAPAAAVVRAVRRGTLLRTAALSPRVTTRIEASVVAGSDLDRFSRIVVRHVRQPAARLSVGAHPLRSRRGGAHGASAGRPPRRFGSMALPIRRRCTIPAFGRGLRNYTGVGAAIEAPAPFGTLLPVEWGYGVQGVNTDGTRRHAGGANNRLQSVLTAVSCAGSAAMACSDGAARRGYGCRAVGGSSGSSRPSAPPSISSTSASWSSTSRGSRSPA